MPRTGPRHPSRQDLASLTDKPTKPRDFLVVDQVDLFGTEVADLLMGLTVALIGGWRHRDLALLLRRECHPDQRRAWHPRHDRRPRRPRLRPAQRRAPGVGRAAPGTEFRWRSPRGSCASHRPALPRSAPASAPRPRPAGPFAAIGLECLPS